MGLYASTKRMTTMFCTGIICVTVMMLALRLTVFSDMALIVSADSPETMATLQGGAINGDKAYPYKLNSQIYFAKASAKGDVLIQNPEESQYLLSIDIVLPDSKDSLYYTGTIAPGTLIDKAAMSAAGKQLADGVYDCVAMIAAFDPENQTKIASEEIPVSIYIGEKPGSSDEKTENSK